MTKANKVRLTDTVISRAQPRDVPYQIWDSVQRGLAVRVETSGFKVYKAIYNRQGRTRWYSIGPVDAIKLDAARIEAGEVMLRVLKGEDPAASKRAKRTSGTFGELAQLYLNVWAKKKNKSWKQADALVKRVMKQKPSLRNLSASTVNRSDIRAALRKIESKTVVNQTLAALSAIFSWAIDGDDNDEAKAYGIENNPCSGMSRNETESRKRVLSDSELPKFWAEFDQAGMEGMVLKVLLLTGQRPGEVRHMRSEHIVDGCWWEMPGLPDKKLNWPGTKNTKSHRVWLPKVVQAIIADCGSDGLVFAGQRGGVLKIDVVMQSIFKKLEVKKITPHDLRRTHGAAITGLKFGRDAMNRIQNHKEGCIADVYEYADDDKKIMEAVASKLMTLIDGTSVDNVVAFDRSK